MTNKNPDIYKIAVFISVVNDSNICLTNCYISMEQFDVARRRAYYIIGFRQLLSVKPAPTFGIY